MRHPVSTSLIDAVLLPLPAGEGWGEGTSASDLCVALDVGPEPGVRPGGRVTFFVSPKKVTKERRPHCLRPLRFAPGQPAVLTQPACRRTRCVHFVHCAQTAAASQITKHACPSAGVRPAALRSSAQPEGSGSGRRFARPLQIPTAQSPITRHGAYVFNPLWACRGAQLQAAREAGIRSLRKAKLCGYQKGPRVFERSEFARTPPEASTAGCPQRSGGSRTVGSPFLCLLSFGEAKESESPAGANSRLLSHTKRNAQTKRRSALTPTLSRREREKVTSTELAL